MGNRILGHYHANHNSEFGHKYLEMVLSLYSTLWAYTVGSVSEIYPLDSMWFTNVSERASVVDHVLKTLQNLCTMMHSGMYLCQSRLSSDPVYNDSTGKIRHTQISQLLGPILRLSKIVKYEDIRDPCNIILVKGITIFCYR